MQKCSRCKCAGVNGDTESICGACSDQVTYHAYSAETRAVELDAELSTVMLQLMECALAEERVRCLHGPERGMFDIEGLTYGPEDPVCPVCITKAPCPTIRALDSPSLCGDGTPCDPGAPYPAGDTLSGGE